MAGQLTKKERLAMPQLVWDCMQYNLEEKEALIYINTRLGRDATGVITEGKFRGVTTGALYHYKRMVKKGEFTQNWLNEFTKIGYVVSHHKLISTADEEFQFIVRRLFMEKNRTKIVDGKRVEDINLNTILKLHEDLRQQGYYINRLNDTTPIVAQVREILERQRSGQPTTESGKTVPTEQQIIPPVE